MDFSLDALEYQRLKELLGRYVSTEAARQVLAELAPKLDPERIEYEHAITAEAMLYLREYSVPFNDIAFLSEALGKLSIAGSNLEIAEIAAVQSFLSEIGGLRTRWKDERDKFPRLREAGQRLPDFRDLRNHLDGAVHNGEINESRYSELARIRRALSVVRSRLTNKLESILRKPAYSSQLQDQLITIRNGRFVIPVRTEQKRGVEGIIHGTSSSGATVFMEPLAVLDMNNELVRLQEEERYEIARILTELTERIRASQQPMEHARSVAAYIELTFAKARFGRDFDCAQPSLSETVLFRLNKARHPLLEDNLRREHKTISPVSIDMDSSRNVLVISGPNAGGKTVVLKTAGLLALMAQSGIPIPAEEACVPILDRVLADIGDQQSLTNHLSTFSAHILAIKCMLESATARSLILLDEIGSSTEPGEGAALARAVLDQFRQVGALTIATTHYNRLKLYAETTPGVANAAMEFNEVTLEPTYRLIQGLSGASSGLKIAERLQLPGPVLASAVRNLEAADLEAAHYVEELRRRIADLESQTARLDQKRKEFDDWKLKELDQVRARHKEGIARFEKKLEQIVREMSDRASRELQSVRDESARKFQKRLTNARADALREIRQEEERIDSVQPLQAAGPTKPAETAIPVEGDAVRIESLGVVGKVMALVGEEAEILAGNIRLRRPVRDLRVLEKSTVRLPAGVHLSVTSEPLEKSEINLVGRRVDDAVDAVDKFLDDAFLAQMRQVRIVHGTGTGALRQAISVLLAGHPHVARFEPAPHTEGGRGVTIVTLKN